MGDSPHLSLLKSSKPPGFDAPTPGLMLCLLRLSMRTRREKPYETNFVVTLRDFNSLGSTEHRAGH